jgi:hypothetical protein
LNPNAGKLSSSNNKINSQSLFKEYFRPFFIAKAEPPFFLKIISFIFLLFFFKSKINLVEILSAPLDITNIVLIFSFNNLFTTCFK